MRGYFITGTDTDAGKTAVTASLGKHMGSLLNDRLVLIKPVQTGCLKQPDGSWLAPDEAVYAELGCRGKALFRYEPPCSPHLAASLAGDTLSVAALAEAVRGAVPEGDAVLVEGAGGCQVPLSDGENMMDLMLALGLPVILVTANRLGCINHALLSLEALQSRGLRCAGVILNRTRPGSEPAAPVREARRAAPRVPALHGAPRYGSKGASLLRGQAEGRCPLSRGAHGARGTRPLGLGSGRGRRSHARL